MVILLPLKPTATTQVPPESVEPVDERIVLFNPSDNTLVLDPNILLFVKVLFIALRVLLLPPTIVLLLEPVVSITELCDWNIAF